ncbi:DUF4861 family protein [Pedobacter rhodius]|uniref:DUF4861 family protein n=1 Tax=Pedobacter rhodius TaxID=3004098 RepID=A0ABT4KXC6_9SPHI|nr:DUF4861 family protein [Pedobacter sp. SJ11]MCZ4223484.1 DUF4861 family protein [Pedobacter sp. SJ11]
MDIYKVGSSLSAGALALSLKLPDGKDSLIRLGGVNMGKVIYEQVADGPLRAIFRMHYPEWNFAKGYGPISLTEEISIWGGQYYYQSRIIAENMPENANLVTGFANLYGLQASEMIGKHARALYSYGLQSENKDNLGLAIIVPDQLVKAFKQTTSSEKDIKDSYLVYFQSKKQKIEPTFRFYACWQASDYRFSDSAKFNLFLNEQLKLADQPLNLSWK